MVRGKRLGSAGFGGVVFALSLASSGACSDSDGKGRLQCGADETRICVQRDAVEECACESRGGSGGTASPAGGSAGRGGSLGGSGAAAGGTVGSGTAGSGFVLDAGPSGSGGSVGSGATGGASGATGSGGGGMPGSGALGAACTSNVDCGAGLVCITATSSVLGGNSPPRGLCTADCGADAAVCQNLDPSALCVNFGNESTPALYCVEGCTFGPPGSNRDPNKCRGRAEFACAPLFAPTGLGCTTDANCGAGEICGGPDGCYQVFSACLPQCNEDIDCGSGRYCDPASGMCIAGAKTGLPVGAQCTPPAPGGVDPCRGNCVSYVASDVTTTISVCAESCTVGALPSCGWNGPASGVAAPAFCLFASTVVTDRGGPGPGDIGSCGQLCNCNTDCRHPGLVCIAFPSDLSQATQRRGYCTLPEGNPGIPCP